jgi:hypothetical protein
MQYSTPEPNKSDQVRPSYQWPISSAAARVRQARDSAATARRRLEETWTADDLACDLANYLADLDRRSDGLDEVSGVLHGLYLRLSVGQAILHRDDASAEQDWRLRSICGSLSELVTLVEVDASLNTERVRDAIATTAIEAMLASPSLGGEDVSP